MAPHRSVHAFTARFFPHSSVSLRWAVAAFALLAALCWASPAWAVDSAVFASGAGTEADPYLIENASQLAAFRDAVNAGDDYDGKYVALGADVDLEGAEWTPIGAGTRKSSGIAEGSTPFAGTFDGAGHTVSGLKITSTQGADYAIGLFGILDGATAKNLTVADTKIAVPQSELAGILCGMLANDSTVSGVSVSGSVSGKAGVGGIAGRMTLSGTIENCENSASVTAAGGVGNAGGIVGAAYYTTPTGHHRMPQQREHFRHRLHRRHRRPQRDLRVELREQRRHCRHELLCRRHRRRAEELRRRERLHQFRGGFHE